MNEEQEQITENPIEEFGSSIIRTDRGTVYVLTIVGQIEGHQILPPSAKTTKYEHVMPLLANLELKQSVGRMELPASSTTVSRVISQLQEDHYTLRQPLETEL